MKRKVTVALSPWSEGPLEASQCVYKQFEITTDKDEQLKCFAVSVENKAGIPGGDSDKTFHSSSTILDGNDIDNLVGKLLTYIDATYPDKEQRNAHKKLIRQLAWDWFKYQRENGEKTINYAVEKEV